MNQTKVKTFNVRYASQTNLTQIEPGFINKTACGCGITSLAIEKEEGNVIVAVPSINLVANKVNQYPNDRFKDTILGVTGETLDSDIDLFIRSKEGRSFKILVTYDSLRKVEYLLENAHLIIDESDKLLSWISMKTASKKMNLDDILIEKQDSIDVINYLLDVAKKYKETVSFLSATPAPLEYYNRQWMKEIDQITYYWDNSVVSQPILLERSFPIYALKHEILMPLKNNGEVTVGGSTFKKVMVFYNSVQGVNQIVEECGLDLNECGIKCGDSVKNSSNSTVKRITDCKDFPKYLFITSSDFSGSDMYDEEAMTIVISSTKKDWQMIDLDTDLKQAISRQRLENNPNYGKYIFIYNQSVFKLSEEELVGRIDTIYHDLDNIVKELNKFQIRKKKTYKSFVTKLITNDDFFNYTIYKDGKWSINELRFNADKYFILNTRNSYTKGFKIMKDLQPIIIEKPEEINDCSYSSIYEKFQEYLNGVEVEWSDEEINCNNYKMISEYFSKFNKLEANSTRCKLMLENTGGVKDAKGMASNYFKVGTRYSNADVIKTLQLVYNQIGLKRTAKSKDLMELFQDVRKGVNTGERYMEIIKK